MDLELKYGPGSVPKFNLLFLVSCPEAYLSQEFTNFTPRLLDYLHVGKW